MPLFEGDFNAWSNPDPKRDFQLSIAFAIQRGNVRMLQRCAAAPRVDLSTVVVVHTLAGYP